MQRAGSNGYHQIGAVLRREWLRGTWQAGRQCPSHAELQRRFQSTEVTIQRAMHLLARQGFIETHLRRGRFLAARAPVRPRLPRPPGRYRAGVVPVQPGAVCGSRRAE